MMNGFPGQALDQLPMTDMGTVSDLFERFLREQREGLVRFLCTRLPSEADAQDAAQESLARLVRYRDAEPPHSWRPLLYRIAVNVALDQQRQAQTRRSDGHVSYDQVLFALPSADPAPDERLARQQMLDRMWEVVQALPPRCRDVYVLNRTEGMSYPQIADLYGISIKAVEKHITRALSALRRELGDWAPEACVPSGGQAVQARTSR